MLLFLYTGFRPFTGACIDVNQLADTNELPNLSGYWLYFYSICVVTPPQASRGFLLCAPAGRFQHIYSLNNKNDVN